MALTVNFWNFVKKVNSTAIPAASPARTFSCTLKSDCSLLAPSIELGVGLPFNPAGLNYAEIPDFDRYYWVGDWQWTGGLWTAPLTVDPLASFRSIIGTANKYVLRSSYDEDSDLADDFYPAKALLAADEVLTATFNWAPSISGGDYVLGLLNYQTADDGSPVTYYRVSPDEIRTLLSFMMPYDSSGWSSMSSMAKVEFIQKIYGPADFIVSCKWFPYGVSCAIGQSQLAFGNYISPAHGNLVLDPSSWTTFQRIITLPSDWHTRQARKRVNPYCHVYLRLNPWGVIELDPADLSRCDSIKITIKPDYMSGDGLLSIYAVETNRDALIYQASAKTSLDIQLSNATTNASGVLGGIATAIGAAVAGVTGTGAAVKAASVIAAAGGVAAAAGNMEPSLSRSGGLTGGIATLDGEAELRIRTCQFPQERNDEFGRPLYQNRILSQLPGFLKLGDGDFQAVGAMKEELDMIGEFFTGGFFYE